jgi:hypothetical protein
MSSVVANFKKLAESGKTTGLFVDKTLFINEIIANNAPLLITRPRRWGKTLNMNMLFYYFAHRDQLKKMGKTDEYVSQCNALFNDLNIFNTQFNPNVENTKSHMGQYPTIFISFALSGDVSNDWGQIKGLIVHRIADLFSEFSYLAQELQKQVRQKFNVALSEKIKEYKERFNVESIPNNMQENLYKETTLDQSHFQEQKDLEEFERIRDGNPKNAAEISNSINFLAQLLSQFHGKPTYIFVDEYDSLINKYFDDQETLSHLTQTFSGIFSAFSKPNGAMNDHLKTVIFTGILRVAKANIFSELNNLEEYTVFDKLFSQYYGFTKQEIHKLLTKTNKLEHMDQVEQWYNGYHIGKEVIYNPWSVMQFMIRGEFDTYWVNTARPGIIKDIILNNKGHMINNQLRNVVKNGVHKTLCVEANKSVSVEDLTNPKSIWSFLIHTGYLTTDAVQLKVGSGMFECQVRIPNTEILCIYNTIIHDWLEQNSAITGAVVNVFDQNYEGFADNLRNMLENKYSAAIFAKEENSVEEVYHSLLLTELTQDASIAQYSLLPEEYSGDGRADILFVDNKNKILVPIELKRAHSIEDLVKNAEQAVEQAINKKYGEDPKYIDYTHHPAIGISFFGVNLVIKIAHCDKIITRIRS